MSKPTVKILNDSDKKEALPFKSKTADIQDEKGRKFTLKKINALAHFRLVEALGSELSSNTQYMGMALVLLHIHAIDDVLVVINKKSDVEALLNRLDYEGIQFVSNAISEVFKTDSQEEVEKAIKK